MRNIKVTVASNAGFCFGVSRAVGKVFEMLDAGESLCLLGPIIHSDLITNELLRRGAVLADSPDDQAAAGRKLVIRTHGVPRAVYARIRELGMDYVDLTCPDVGRIHAVVRKAAAEGRDVYIIGDPRHPEVVATLGFCAGDGGARAMVFRDGDALAEYARECGGRLERPCILVAQTTLNRDTWRKSCEVAEKVCTIVQVFDTICYATYARQEEAARLADSSDAMVVVGGFNSSNTKKLYEVCAARCGNTVWCEDACGLGALRVADGARIGVVAGASTPSCVIKEVVNRMISEENVNPVILEEGTPATEESAVTAAPVDGGEGQAAQQPAAEKPAEAAADQADGAGDAGTESSADDMDFAVEMEKSFVTLSSGDRVRGVVAAVNPNEIQVDLGTKQSGYVPLGELTDDPSANLSELFKPGDEIDLFVVRVNDVEGTIMLSKKKIDSMKGWDEIEAAAGTGEIFDGQVIEAVKGGMIVSSKGVKVFIPMSQISTNRNTDPATLVRTPVRFVVLETDRRRKRAVGSVRAVMREERKALEEKFWTEVEVGKKYTGVVKSITSYGAFVDLGGVDGMVHVTELSWNRVRHPSDIIKEGQTVDVFVKEIDRDRKRISLGYKEQFENPWDTFVKTYNAGDVANVKIVKMMPFGAFAEVMDGVDGLIHISQIADRRIARPQDELEVGQQVDVKIIDIDNEKHKISLSIRALLESAPESAPEQDAAPAAGDMGDVIVATSGGDDDAGTGGDQ